MQLMTTGVIYLSRQLAGFCLPRFLVLLLLFPLPVSAAISKGAPSAFIKELGTAAISMAADKDLDHKARIQRFRHLLTDGFALKWISKFVLGRYWKKASGEQKQRYTKIFEEYMIASYANRLREYGGETFEVTGEKLSDRNSATVSTLILRPKRDPVRVIWQIRDHDDKLKIVDVVIEGISMSLTQRSDFASAIRSKGGNIDAFLDALERKIRTR